MNHLGDALLWSAAQVTLLALAAAGLYALLRRRGPAAGSAVLCAALGCTVALTFLALCPLPAWWSLPQAAPPPAAPSTVLDPTSSSQRPTFAERSPSSSTPNKFAWLLSLLRPATSELPAQAAASTPFDFHWQPLVLTLFSVGVAFGTLKLLLGVWSVHRCQRRSSPVNDVALGHLLTALCHDMACRRRVVLRECADLAGPATVGWLKPIILLPPTWKGWTEAERRAALAHELAHVRRGDYLARLIARLSATLHFYHPLVAWLAGRLHLQQELAADDLAADHAGGRATYLVSLARLALAQDGRSLGWPARALSSEPGTLMERIAMLRTKDRSPTAPPSTRFLAVGLLGVVALSVSTLRSPAERIDAPQSNPPSKPTAAGGAVKTETKGYSLTLTLQDTTPIRLPYLADDHAGFYSFRPAAIFGRAEMKDRLNDFDKTTDFQSICKLLNVEPDAVKLLASVEQIWGRVSLKTNKKQTTNPTQLMLDVTTIRLKHNFDGKKLFESILPGSTAVDYAGATYYRCDPAALSNGVLKDYSQVIESQFMGDFIRKSHLCYHFPDARTIVLDSEENLRHWLDGKSERTSSPDAKADWARVEGGLFAVALDDHNLSWFKDRLESPAETPAFLLDLIRNTHSLAIGVDYAEGKAGYMMVLRSPTDAQAQVVEKAFQSLLKLFDAKLKESSVKRTPSKGERTVQNYLQALRKNYTINRDGKCLSLQSVFAIDFNEWLSVIEEGGLPM